MSTAPRVASGVASGVAPTRPPAHLTEIAPPERLTAALRVAVRGNGDSFEGVRPAVAAYVHALRAQGKPPQAVLVSVKDLVRRTPASGAAPFELPGDRAGAARRKRLALTAAVVCWAIDAYYGSDSE